MFVEWNDRELAAVDRQPETLQSARGDTRTKLPPRSWEWSAIALRQPTSDSQ